MEILTRGMSSAQWEQQDADQLQQLARGVGWLEGPAEGQQECSLPAVTILQFNAMPNGKC